MVSGNDNENDEINEILRLSLFVFVCFYHKGFYNCNEDRCGIYIILGVNYVISLVCFIIYCNNFFHYNEDYVQFKDRSNSDPHLNQQGLLYIVSSTAANSVLQAIVCSKGSIAGNCERYLTRF